MFHCRNLCLVKLRIALIPVISHSIPSLSKLSLGNLNSTHSLVLSIIFLFNFATWGNYNRVTTAQSFS